MLPLGLGQLPNLWTLSSSSVCQTRDDPMSWRRQPLKTTPPHSGQLQAGPFGKVEEDDQNISQRWFAVGKNGPIRKCCAIKLLFYFLRTGVVLWFPRFMSVLSVYALVVWVCLPRCNLFFHTHIMHVFFPALCQTVSFSLGLSVSLLFHRRVGWVWEWVR